MTEPHLRVLIPAEKIQRRIEELGARVTADFPDFPLRPLAKGLDYVTSGKVAYTVRNGRFATIECL